MEAEFPLYQDYTCSTQKTAIYCIFNKYTFVTKFQGPVSQGLINPHLINYTIICKSIRFVLIIVQLTISSN